MKYKGNLISWDVVQQQDNTSPLMSCLTQREQMILLMALTPLKWRTRWQDLPENQDLDFIDDLIGKLMIDQSCCDFVLSCLKTGPGIETIKEILRGGGETNVTKGFGEGSATLAACSEDYVFGAISRLIQFMIDSARDFLELFETATNYTEIAEEWLERFNIVIPPVVQAVIDYVIWVQDSILENFESNLTVALQDEYRCDLFCLWIDDCKGLSARDVSQYFLGRISGEGLQETLEDLIVFLTTGSWSGTQIIDAMMAGVIGIMTVDLNWIPFINIPTLYAFESVILLGADDPNNDWEILCNECNTPTWCYVFDFTATNGDFTAPNRGQWTLGIGWVNTDDDRPSAENQGIFIDGENFSDTVITHFDMEYTLQSDSAGTRTARVILRNGSSNAIVEENTDNVTDGHITWDGNEASINEIRMNVDIRQGSDTLNAGETAIIKSLTVRGEGVNPFGVDNC